jgi:hypothetical protein
VAIGPAAEAQTKRVSLWRTLAAEMEFHSSLAFLDQASVAASIAVLAAGSPRMS